MSVRFACYHLPSSCEDYMKDRAFKRLPFGELELEVPILEKEDMTKIAATVKANRAQYLANLSTNEIIDIIDQAIWKWLDPTYKWRQVAEEWLPKITGYDKEMIRLFLSRYLRHFRKEKLQRMVDEDFSNPFVLDEFRPRKAGGFVRAYGPELTTHIFSGNVPALPLWSMTAGLLLKSATIGKVSSSEPLFPVLFAKTLEEIDLRFADTLAILWWKGGQQNLEVESYKHSEAVIAYGSDQTIKAVRENVPLHTPFFAHGHKVSFGVITEECLDTTKAWSTAKLAAQDVSSFDQQGCLSPHVFFVETGGKYSPRDFVHMLSHEMNNYQHKHPRASVSEDENYAIVKARSTVEFESFNRSDVALEKSEDSTAWTVVYEEKPESFPVSPLNRFVTVVPIDQLEELETYVQEIKGFIQTTGIACAPQKYNRLISVLGQLGVNRICALGSMSQPLPGWHHDGRFYLADLVRWCDVEGTVEEQMEQFDRLRE